MTFIASVVSKKGAAIIADSLVTSVRRTADIEDFWEYLDNKEKAVTPNGDPINIDLNEIINLFKDRPSHTKNYEDKLIKYDKYTAITTAGGAEINDKRIAEIVIELSERNHTKSVFKSYNAKSIETKIEEFCQHFTKEIKEHLEKYNSISETTFIFTHYTRSTHKTTIYKIQINSSTKADLAVDDFKFIEAIVQNEKFPVVCDGQNRISEKILFGDRDAYFQLIPKIVEKLSVDFEIPKEKITDEYLFELMTSQEIIDSKFYDGMKIFQLSKLSLQQAVDLACLLMKIEMDFQKYTTNIPTVGGVIKLAVIDDNGFRYLSGYNVTKPDFI